MNKPRRCPACTADPKPRAHTDAELKEFHPLRYEFEKAAKGINFTKDFNPAIEALMHDKLETHAVRILAWIKRMAWGNHCLYCINEDGSEAYQVDCEAQLGIDKRLVSKTMKYLENRGYISRPGIGKVIYPVISPSLNSAPGEDKKSKAWATFVESWKVTHSTDFLELEVARSTVQRIRKVMRSDYKQSRAPGTDSSAYKEESSESPESGVSASSVISINRDSSSSEHEEPRRRTASSSSEGTGTPSASVREPEAITDLQEVAGAMHAYGPSDHIAARKLARLCLEQSPDATVSEVIAVIHEKGPQAKSRGTATGFLLTAVPRQFEPNAIARWRHDRANPQERALAAGEKPDKMQASRAITLAVMKATGKFQNPPGGS